MTHEQFITLETARLAKQAGFDWEVETFYSALERACRGEPYNWNGETGAYQDMSRPTQSVLQRWLREVKGISVEVCHVIVWVGDGTLGIKWTYSVCHLNSNESDILPSDEFDTFEAALEAGLQECLTLIIKKQ